MKQRPVLVIGNKNYSSWSLRPWLLLRHFGVDFDEVRLVLDSPQFAREAARWSPTRRVPALHHGDLAVWDSLAICEYVDETFLDRAGWPADADARAVARSVSAEMHAGFGALRSAMPFNCRRRSSGFVATAEVQRDVDRVCELWRDCRARFGNGGAWLFNGFSIADAMYAPVALRFVSYGIVLDADARAYVDTVLGDSGVQEWLRDSAAETETLPSTDRVG